MTRKSKREIESRIEDLDPSLRDDYPLLDDLAMLFGYEWDFESMGEDRLVEREEDGKKFLFPEEIEETVRDLFTKDG